MNTFHKGWTQWRAGHMRLQVKHTIESVQVETVHHSCTCHWCLVLVCLQTKHNDEALQSVAVPGRCSCPSSCWLRRPASLGRAAAQSLRWAQPVCMLRDGQ